MEDPIIGQETRWGFCSDATTARVFLLACTMLVAAGCGGGGGSSQTMRDGSPPTDPAPTTPNPVGLTFRSVELGTPAAPDGRDYRTPEFLRHHGLDAISADKAYERGYFGQGVNIAIADDGMDITHPELAGRIKTPRHVVNHDDRVFEIDYEDDGTGHGTYVAMIAAGARANDSGQGSGIKVHGGAPIPTPNFHGVAPQASIIPIALSGGGQPPAAVRHAVASGAQAMNFSIGYSNSYFGEYAGREGIWLTAPLPFFGPLTDGGLRRDMAQVAAAVERADIVMVWAAGNDGWNSRNNQTRLCGKNHFDEDGCLLGEGPVSAQEFMKNFTYLPDPDNPNRKIPFKDMWGTGCGSDDCADYNSGGEWKEAPLFEPGLLGKWLVVGALDRNGEIAGFSNGCGAARNWCLMAPGENITVGPDGRGISGTSFAAPFVTGALAVLKSRLPSMPMEVVQAALLFSADPLGTRVNNLNEPDPVYGWGRLNLGNAVTMQGTVSLPYSVAGTTQAVTLRDARVNLSPVLAHVGERMQAVEIAVGGVGNAYYNMKLSGIVDFETANPLMPGYAARDMLAPAGGYRVEHQGLYANIDQQARDLHAVGMDFSANMLGRWRLHHTLCDGCERSAWREWNVFQPAAVATAPFFARAGGSVVLQMQGNSVRPFAAFSGRRARHAPWRQFGLQWRHVRGGIDVVAEFSRIDESRSVWGANFGSLGGTRTETNRSQLFLSGPLGRNWRGFASYEHNFAEVSMTSGMLAGISGLRAEGWSAGSQGRNIFRDNDTLRFSVRQETRVRDGRARINHLVATGSSFVDAFYRGRSQSLTQQRTAIDLSTCPMIRYSLGYALPLQNNSALAFGLEYEDETRNGGISTQFRMDF